MPILASIGCGATDPRPAPPIPERRHRALAGEEVVIARAGKPLVRLVPSKPSPRHARAVS